MKPLPLCAALALLSAIIYAPSLRAQSSPEEMATWTKAADNKIFAQKLVNRLMAEHPELLVVGLHATAPGGKDQKMIATNLDRVGKKDDDDDLAVAAEHKTICAPNLKEPNKFEVQVPLEDSKGNFIPAAAGFVFKYKAGDDEVKMHRLALAFRDEIARETPDVEALFAPTFTSTPGLTVTIPDSKGKFDFLAVDPAAHRLLAAHEKDGTADFIDLDKGALITRVKVGPAVGIAVDPRDGRYFASVQDDKRLAVIDGKTLKETGSVELPGETDAILFDAGNRRIYVTHDEGDDLFAVDPDSLKLAATIKIPGVPEMMALDPHTGLIYLNIKSKDLVAVIDTKSDSVIATWPTAPAKAPHGLVFDAKLGRIYSSGDNGKLVAFEAKTGSVVSTTDIVEHVDQIAFDPDNSRVYCAGPGWMSVVQAGPGGLNAAGRIETAGTARNVAVDRRTHAVWTTFTDGANSYAKSWTISTP